MPAAAPVPEPEEAPGAPEIVLDTPPQKADTKRKMKAKAKSRPRPAAKKAAKKAAPKRSGSKPKGSGKLSMFSASKRLPGQPAKSRR